MSYPGQNAEKYEYNKTELQKALTTFYREKKNTIQVCPSCPDFYDELDKLYVQSRVTIVKVREKLKQSHEMKEGEMLTYKQIFNIEHVKNIYIQGNPGMGKSIYSAKILLDWCRNITESRNSQDVQDKMENPGLDFEFVFGISLRECSHGTCEVFQMIKELIISQLSYQRKKFNDQFLSFVLDNERCLIILDGLDEWAHHENRSCRRPPEKIPHRSAGGRCVYLTLTRPWKLNQICLKDSEVDVLLEIDGVREPKDLITNAIKSLNRNEKRSKDVDKCVTATKHLSSLTTIPLTAMQLVGIWYEKETIPISECDIYYETIKMMFERKNINLCGDQTTTDNIPESFSNKTWSEKEKRFLKPLGALAFETLFPEGGQAACVIFENDLVNRHLESQSKLIILSAGLLTQYKIRSLCQKRSQLSFLHKTFQEFFAALYLTFCIDQNKELVSRIQGKNINDLSQLLVFLCGLKPSLATLVSEVLMETTKLSLEENRCLPDNKDNIVKTVSEIIHRGLTECKQNKHGNGNLALTHVYINYNFTSHTLDYPNIELLLQNEKKVETIWFEGGFFDTTLFRILNSSSGSVTTLYLGCVFQHLDFNMLSCLKALTVHTHFKFPNGCLDMSECQNLEYLHINQSNLPVFINTDRLQTCRLWGYNFTIGNILKTLTKRNSEINYLTIEECEFPEMNSKMGQSFHLDLSACSKLKELWISGHDKKSVSINSANLEKCDLRYGVDISLGNLQEALSNSTKLTSLTLWDCRFPSVDDRYQSKVFIDLSACTNLTKSNIDFRDSDIQCNRYPDVDTMDNT